MFRWVPPSPPLFRWPAVAVASCGPLPWPWLAKQLDVTSRPPRLPCVAVSVCEPGAPVPPPTNSGDLREEARGFVGVWPVGALVFLRI